MLFSPERIASMGLPAYVTLGLVAAHTASCNEGRAGMENLPAINYSASLWDLVAQPNQRTEAHIEALAINFPEVLIDCLGPFVVSRMGLA